jgi:hypothetical protein
MLNATLALLKNEGVFDHFGKAKTLSFLNEIRKIGCENDCNDGEILDEIGEELGICYSCWDYGDEFEYGICKKCRSKFKN